MKDFAIEPHGNKFLRERNGMRFTNGYLEYMALKARSAISLFLGEWYLNRKIGIPYIPTTMEKIDHRPLIETALIVTISNLNGIGKVLSFETSYDAKERILKVHFIAQCDNGENLEYIDDIPIEKAEA